MQDVISNKQLQDKKYNSSVELVKKIQREYRIEQSSLTRESVVTKQISHVDCSGGGYEQYYRMLEKQFEPLLKSVVYHYKGLDNQEDIYQVARLSFFEGVIKFDVDAGVFFEYYIKRKVFGDVRTHTRRVMTAQEKVDYSLDAGKFEGDNNRDSAGNSHYGSDVCADNGNVYGGGIGDNLIWEDMLQRLPISERERQIIDLTYRYQYRQIEVARIIGVDASTIGKALKRVKKIVVSYADASKAERVLGWKAELTIEDMVRDAWGYESNR